MTLLNFLERLGTLPPEAWLVPPVVILAGIWTIGLTRRRARLRRYRAIAARTGLTVIAKIFNASEIRGIYAGRELVMTLASRQRPTFRKNWTVVRVDVKNPEFVQLFMRRQDRFDTLVMSAGGRDVQAGDAEFDRRFVIQSKEAALVATLFQDRGLRELIVHSNIDTVRLVGSTLRVYSAREERSPEHADLLFSAVARLADGIDALVAEPRTEIIRM